MKKLNFMAILLSGCLVLSSCGMTNTAKGGMIGGGGGAALGALVGGVFGKGKGAAIGAAVGTAVGATTGILVGKKMDKAAAAAKAVEGAEVEKVTDSNGLDAVKVTFDSGILFASGSTSLSTSAQSSLSKFANDVLNQNKDMDVAIYGYTDNQGWKSSSKEQSMQKNMELSQARAQSVASYLSNCGVSTNQLKTIKGYGEENPIADNSTASGREANRRVEVYMYASQQMIKDAEAGTLK